MSDKKIIKIVTRDFGEQEIYEENIISFPKGIFAFEDSKRFILLSPMGDEASPMWLQSVDNLTPCFIVFKALDIISDYKPEPEKHDLEVLNIEDGDEIEFLAIAVITEDYKKSTINLKSPIVINRNKAIATQVILPQEFEIKFPIFREDEEA